MDYTVGQRDTFSVNSNKKINDLTVSNLYMEALIARKMGIAPIVRRGSRIDFKDYYEERSTPIQEYCICDIAYMKNVVKTSDADSRHLFFSLPGMKPDEVLYVKTTDFCLRERSKATESWKEIEDLSELSNYCVHIKIESSGIPEYAKRLFAYKVYFTRELANIEKENDKNENVVDLELIRQNWNVFESLDPDSNTVVIPMRKSARILKSIVFTGTDEKKHKEVKITSCVFSEMEINNEIRQFFIEEGVRFPNRDYLFSLQVDNDRDIYRLKSLLTSGEIDNVTVKADISGDSVRLKRIIGAINQINEHNVENQSLVNAYCNEEIESQEKYIPNSTNIARISEFYPHLNKEQIETLDKILQMDEKSIDLMLVQGPPGTGKTELILSAVKELSEKGKDVLVTSNVHVACNNIVERLKNEKEVILKRYTTKPGDEEYKREKYDNARNYLKNQVLAYFSYRGKPISSMEDYIALENTQNSLKEKKSNYEKRYIGECEKLSTYNEKSTELNTKIDGLKNELLLKSKKKKQLEDAQNTLEQEVKELPHCIGKETERLHANISEKNKYESAQKNNSTIWEQKQKEWTELKVQADSAQKEDLDINERACKVADEYMEVANELRELLSKGHADTLIVERCYADTKNAMDECKPLPEYPYFEKVTNAWNRYLWLRRALGSQWYNIVNGKRELTSLAVSEMIKYFDRLPFAVDSNSHRIHLSLEMLSVKSYITGLLGVRMRLSKNKEFLVNGINVSINGIADANDYLIFVIDEYVKVDYGARKYHEIEHDHIFEKINDRLSSDYYERVKKLTEHSNMLRTSGEELENEAKDAHNMFVAASRKEHSARIGAETLKKEIDRIQKKIGVFGSEIEKSQHDLETMREMQTEKESCIEKVSNEILEISGQINIIENELSIVIAEKDKLDERYRMPLEAFRDFETHYYIDISSLDNEIAECQITVDRILKSVNNMHMESVSDDDKWGMLFTYVGELARVVSEEELATTLPDDGSNFFESFEWDAKDPDRGSLISMTTNQIAKATDMVFDYAIVDEASKCSFEDIVICLPKVKHLVLIGDYMQLDPYYDRYSNLSNWQKQCFGEKEWIAMNDSGFSRLFTNMLQNGIKGDTAFHECQNIGIMKKQYRMNKGIYNLISPIYKIYDGFELEDEKKQTANDVLCIDMDAEEDTNSSNEIITNEQEAMYIAKLVQMINDNRDMFSGIKTVGVITGYAGQVRKIKQKIRGAKIRFDGLQIGTFDRFQGREYDLVLISMVRSKTLGFMKDVRRMNVALSRAKKHLVVIGNFTKLARLPMPVMDASHDEEKEVRFVYKELLPALKRLSVNHRFSSVDDGIREVANFLKENNYDE